jgi:hypothetical protein
MTYNNLIYARFFSLMRSLGLMPGFVFTLVLVFLVMSAVYADIEVANNNDDGAGSLRQAISDITAGETINFHNDLNDETILLSSQLKISQNLTIDATTLSSGITISGNNSVRVFEITNIVTDATIKGVTIKDGGNSTSPDYGGGISNAGMLKLYNSTIKDNQAKKYGGAIHNTGTLELYDSTINNNTAKYGGGIFNEEDNNSSAKVTLNNCTIDNNSATNTTAGRGGAILNKGKEINLNNSTISGNNAKFDGGGIYNNYNDAILTLNNSTIVNNIADSNNTSGDGGGILNSSGTVNIKNTIIAGNKKGTTSPTDDDCSGIINTFEYNLSGNGTGCPTVGTGNVTVTPADVFTDVLGPLADNGGSIQTHALLLGSPAIDVGDSSTLATDQTGICPRAYNGTVDIGAYEFNNGTLTYDFSAATFKAQEGNTTNTTNVVTVTRCGDTIGTSSVDVGLADNTAKAGNDFTAGSITVDFITNEITKKVPIELLGDADVESDEIIDLSFSVTPPDTLGSINFTATLTILNDEIPIYDFSIANFTTPEGNATNTINVVTITRSGDTSIASEVDVILTDGTAIAGTDFTAGPITINFSATDTNKPVPIELLGDITFEPDETIALSFANFIGGGKAGTTQSTATLTITEDDSQPTISINDVPINEGNSGTINADFTVSLSNPSAENITVDYTTEDATATIGNTDYNSANGTLTFDSGDATQTISVVVNGDTSEENNETFNVKLSNPNKATIVDDTGVGTITDDDTTLTQYTLTITNSGTGSGSVTGNTSPYTNGSTVNLTATPTSGSTFGGWSGGCSSSFTITANKSCTATFNQQQITPPTPPPVVPPPPPPDLALPEKLSLILELKGPGNGDISLSPKPEETECDSETRKCTYIYDPATWVTITATSDEDSILKYWSGMSDCIKKDEVSDKVGKSKVFMTKTILRCSAYFKLKPRTLSISYAGDGNGSVSMLPIGKKVTPCDKAQCVEFDGGRTIKFTATANPTTSRFDGWTGNEDCSDDKVIMDVDKTCIANFNLLPTYQLTMSYGGEGMGSVTSTPVGTACGDNCTTYLGDTIIQLTPAPSIDSLFKEWQGDCAPDGQVNMVDNKTCTAVFDKKPIYTLKLTVVGNGLLESTSDLLGTACGDIDDNSCMYYLSGSTVTLTPILGEGSVDSIFSEDCRDGQVIMEGDKDCKIVFTEEIIALPPPPDDPNGPFTLLVKPLGNGNGNVISGIAGIDCGNDCTEVYPKDSAISLKATPDAVSTFDGWGGDCSDGQVSMESNKICTAIFTLIPTHTLTITKVGEGNGTVNNVTGINCGDDCMEVYNTGTSVTLTATPAPDSNFEGWNDKCPAGELVMDIDIECTATFTLKPSYALTVTKAGPGTGVITSNLGGINCGDVCTTSYIVEAPVSVTLTPLALPGSFFTHWEGDCPNGQVNMEADKQCIAVFESFGIVQFAEPEIKTNEESGTVTIMVSRLGGSYGQVSIDYATVAGTALENQDYTPNSGTLIWEIGDSEDKYFTINVLPDRLKEENEIFSVFLSNPSGNVILGTPHQTKLTIENVAWFSTIQFAMPIFMANEGDEKATLLVTRAGSSQWPLSVDYVTIDIKDSAVAGEDYQVVKGTLSWENGDRSMKVIEVPIFADKVEEQQESFVVLLANLSADEAQFGPHRKATINIINTPMAGSLEFSAAEYNIDESVAEVAIIVNRLGNSNGAISVNYATSDDSAKAEEDYTTANGRLTWNTDDVEPKQFIVPIISDDLAETDEKVILTLSNPLGGASLGAVNTAMLTIANFTPPPDSTETVPSNTTQPTVPVDGSVEENPTTPQKPSDGTGEQTGNPTQEEDEPNTPPTGSDTPHSEATEEADCQNTSQIIQCVVVNDDNASPVENVQIAAQGKVIGGKLSGNIQNQGEIRDVTLLPNTHLVGGIVSGKISGPPPQLTDESIVVAQPPAILSNVTVAAKTTLTHIVIGEDVLFEKEVILGKGVLFERNGQIPLNMDLASILGRKSTSILGQYAINLSGDVLYNSAYEGILGAINGLSQLKNNGLRLTQSSNLGLLSLDIGEMRYAVLPMQVTQVFNSQASQELPMGVHFDPTDKITFITHTGREVITHPVIQAPDAFNNTLRGLNLSEAIMLTNGNFKVQANDGIYYTARASLFSTQVSAETPLGIFGDQKGVYKFVFEDDAGNHRQQYMYPSAADTEALSNDNYKVKVKYDGQITVQRENRRYQGRLNYVVTKSQKRDSGLRVFDTIDINGDGYGDYRIDYPNGDSQVIFHLGK